MEWLVATVDAIGDADRAAELLCGVEEPGGEAGVAARAMPASAAIETGMKAKAVPAPATKNGPARLRQKWPSTGTCVAHSTPPPISAMPSAITGLPSRG